MTRWLALAVMVTACQGDETVSGYLGDATVFELVSINAMPFEASATIDLSEQGRISGSAPCNAYFANQSAPYPWFELGPIGATRRACPDLHRETLYFEALARMTLAEVSGSTLILSNTDKEEMVFQASP